MASNKTDSLAIAYEFLSIPHNSGGCVGWSLDRIGVPKVSKGQEYPKIQIEGRMRFLAEIVLLTFGPRPSPQHTVGHTNGKLKADASLEGLAWQDKKEQRADQKKHKKRTAGVKGVKAKKGGYEKEFVYAGAHPRLDAKSSPQARASWELWKRSGSSGRFR